MSINIRIRFNISVIWNIDNYLNNIVFYFIYFIAFCIVIFLDQYVIFIDF